MQLLLSRNERATKPKKKASSRFVQSLVSTYSVKKGKKYLTWYQKPCKERTQTTRPILSQNQKPHIHPPPPSIKRHRRLIRIINIVLHGLNAITTSAENPVPKTSLLSIIMALLPPLPVVQVVILDNKFRVEPTQRKAKRRRRSSVNPQTTMSSQLGENDVLVTDPPFIETHRHAHEAHREPSHQRDTCDIEELLLRVGVECQERVRVFG